jgi:tetratricopeptide (TPR) repeat protein
MLSRRIVLWSVLAAAGVVGLLAGGLAAAGRLRYGAAGWYYRSDPDYRLQCGREALHEGNLERVDQIALVLEADGYKDHAALLRGESYFLQGKEYAEAQQLTQARPRLSAAINEFTKIHDQGELRLRAACILGQSLFFLGDFSSAIYNLKFVLSNQPDNIDAHRTLAGLYFQQGALGPALTHLDRWEALDTKDGRPPRLKALILKDLQQFPAAIDSYHEALSRGLAGAVSDQHPARVRLELAECLVRLSRYDEALAVLGEFEPLPADVALTEALRGECLWAKDRKSEARSVLDQALTESPSSLELLRLRARLYLEDKQFKEAESLYLRALDAADGSEYVARHQLSELYEQSGQKDKAKEYRRQENEIQVLLQQKADLNREASEHPTARGPRLKLAEISEKLRQPQDAEMWRQAAAKCPPEPSPPANPVPSSSK